MFRAAGSRASGERTGLSLSPQLPQRPRLQAHGKGGTSLASLVRGQRPGPQGEQAQLWERAGVRQKGRMEDRGGAGRSSRGGVSDLHLSFLSAAAARRALRRTQSRGAAPVPLNCRAAAGVHLPQSSVCWATGCNQSLAPATSRTNPSQRHSPSKRRCPDRLTRGPHSHSHPRRPSVTAKCPT